MTLDQLQVLDNIVKLGSFRSAAAALRRAQSAVSYSIKTLEEEVGVALFDRDSYRPKLTPEGRALHNKALAILAQAQEFQVLGRQLSLGTEAVIDISVSSLVCFSDLVEKLKDLPKVFPDTQLNLYHDQLRLPFEKTRDEAVAIAISPMVEGVENMERVFWGKSRLYPVCAPGFPALQSLTKLSWADMFHYTQIVVMDPPLVKQETMANVVEGAKRWRVSDFSAMKDLILAGVGWGYLPDFWVAAELKRGKLTKLNLEAGQEEVDFYLIRKRSRPMGPCAQYVWELLRANP